MFFLYVDKFCLVCERYVGGLKQYSRYTAFSARMARRVGQKFHSVFRTRRDLQEGNERSHYGQCTAPICFDQSAEVLVDRSSVDTETILSR